MDSQLTHAKSTEEMELEKELRIATIKAKGTSDNIVSLTEFGMTYQKIPLNLGPTLRQWMHEKMQRAVMAED